MEAHGHSHSRDLQHKGEGRAALYTAETHWMMHFTNAGGGVPNLGYKIASTSSLRIRTDLESDSRPGRFTGIGRPSCDHRHTASCGVSETHP